MPSVQCVSVCVWGRGRRCVNTLPGHAALRSAACCGRRARNDHKQTRACTRPHLVEQLLVKLHVAHAPADVLLHVQGLVQRLTRGVMRVRMCVCEQRQHAALIAYMKVCRVPYSGGQLGRHATATHPLAAQNTHALLSLLMLPCRSFVALFMSRTSPSCSACARSALSASCCCGGCCWAGSAAAAASCCREVCASAIRRSRQSPTLAAHSRCFFTTLPASSSAPSMLLLLLVLVVAVVIMRVNCGSGGVCSTHARHTLLC